VIPPALFFLKTGLAIWGLLWFHTNISIISSSSGILIGIALNLWIALGHMDILIVLVLSIHDHEISFHLFGSSSISVISVFRV